MSDGLNEIFKNDKPMYYIPNDDLPGVPRECPECKIIAHYVLKGRGSHDVNCPECDHSFKVIKYGKNQKPKRKKRAWGRAVINK